MRVLSPKLITLIAGVVAVFLLVSLAQEMNRRLQVQREVAKLQQEVHGLEKTIVEMENLNQYFDTDDFQERMAREKLNYRAAGETVVLITEEKPAGEPREPESVVGHRKGGDRHSRPDLVGRALELFVEALLFMLVVR